MITLFKFSLIAGLYFLPWMVWVTIPVFIMFVAFQTLLSVSMLLVLGVGGTVKVVNHNTTKTPYLLPSIKHVAYCAGFVICGFPIFAAVVALSFGLYVGTIKYVINQQEG